MTPPVALLTVLLIAYTAVTNALAQRKLGAPVSFNKVCPLSVMSVLPKLNWLWETWKWAQPTGCPLSHWCRRKLRSSYWVLQLIFKLRETSSHENWYIYTMRKSGDQWLCTQSQISKRSVHVGKVCAQNVGCPWAVAVHSSWHYPLSSYWIVLQPHFALGYVGLLISVLFHFLHSMIQVYYSHTRLHGPYAGSLCGFHSGWRIRYQGEWTIQWSQISWCKVGTIDNVSCHQLVCRSSGFFWLKVHPLVHIHWSGGVPITRLPFHVHPGIDCMSFLPGYMLCNQSPWHHQEHL